MCTQPHAAGFNPTGARDRALHAQKSAHHAAATTPRNKWHTRGKVLHALHGPRRRDTSWRQFENSNASLKLSGRPLIAKTQRARRALRDRKWILRVTGPIKVPY